MANELANTPEKIKFRENVLGIEKFLQGKIDSGELPSALDQIALRHFFTPVNARYNCCMYAREVFIPRGNLAIGKIHKHPTINFVMKGKVKLGSEDGAKYIEAPSIFVSEPGKQRIGYIIEDCLWATVHLTEFGDESYLDKIENELIAANYHEFDLICSAERLGLESL